MFLNLEKITQNYLNYKGNFYFYFLEFLESLFVHRMIYRTCKNKIIIFLINGPKIRKLLKNSKKQVLAITGLIEFKYVRFLTFLTMNLFFLSKL